MNVHNWITPLWTCKLCDVTAGKRPRASNSSYWTKFRSIRLSPRQMPYHQRRFCLGRNIGLDRPSGQPPICADGVGSHCDRQRLRLVRISQHDWLPLMLSNLAISPRPFRSGAYFLKLSRPSRNRASNCRAWRAISATASRSSRAGGNSTSSWSQPISSIN